MQKILDEESVEIDEPHKGLDLCHVPGVGKSWELEI